ncbi:MAG: hypothetical protein GX895_07060 [Clostridiales bacterium]|uniref:preprotein translocase subunit SecA n=1 Tax=Clostridium sp. N3C TaxID=1776758 RepID=UPI00092DECC4|nr:hypothetical protein [Clostridium sp. N3C]NLZ48535.1 hypothetical protein [Clostridiales bacterium]SCN22814.1 preprotein translocase subunit SecA [Clostridium sp. N3C]
MPFGWDLYRIDYPPYVFTHKEAKYKALIEEIKKVHSTGQPILIGTSSVKESDQLAKLLEEVGISCQVLNAKNDELEAHIIENAGVLGAVTVSTNMAGRGVDILLGGPEGNNREKIKKLGGLKDEILEKDYPKLYESLKAKYSSEEIETFKRNLRLFHMDQHWADYLDKVANLRQGIHLNAIGGKDPLREFQLKLIEQFKALKEEIEESIKEDYKEVELSISAFEELKERIKAPEATWTYLVNDDSIKNTLGLLKGLVKISGMNNFFSWLTFAAEYEFNKLFIGSRK